MEHAVVHSKPAGLGLYHYRELAELRLRYDNDDSRRLRKTERLSSAR